MRLGGKYPYELEILENLGPFQLYFDVLVVIVDVVVVVVFIVADVGVVCHQQ